MISIMTEDLNNYSICIIELLYSQHTKELPYENAFGQTISSQLI
jgi:hypothetical protein